VAYPQIEDLAGAPREEVLRASPRMFESKLLDKVSRVHPSVPLFIFVPAIVIFGWAGFARMAVPETIALIAGEYLFWTLTEYWLHRLVFHFEPEGRLGARLHWIIHGVHHDHPNDPMRLVMPPSLSIPLAAAFFGLFVLVVGTPAAFPIATGFFAGYLFYDMMHYHVHHHRPRTWAGRKLRELHMRHHFQDHTRGFGVSAPFWDHVFGTPTRRRTRQAKS
jgi:dihydroceramide fatty acyl 2-hydroxylase